MHHGGHAQPLQLLPGAGGSELAGQGSPESLTAQAQLESVPRLNGACWLSRKPLLSRAEPPCMGPTSDEGWSGLLYSSTQEDAPLLAHHSQKRTQQQRLPPLNVRGNWARQEARPSRAL